MIRDDDPDRAFWLQRAQESRTNYEETIERLCRLQTHVDRAVFGGAFASDCFCKKGGFWMENYDPVAMGTWRNAGRVLAFIERAVEREIEQYRFDVAESQPEQDE